MTTPPSPLPLTTTTTAKKPRGNMLSRRHLVVFAASLLARQCAAQSDVETVWSSFGFVLHGDRTPLRGGASPFPALTPLGARQLADQGALLRARYLEEEDPGTDDADGGSAPLLRSAPIAGLSRDALDNDQLAVWTSTDEYQAAGALAFIQGLYPPRPDAVAAGLRENGGADLANGSRADWPLDGYQYPNVRTLSLLDSNSIA